MIEYEGHAHQWQVSSGVVSSEREHHDQHRMVFGVEYAWTSLLPLAWSLIDNPLARIDFPKLDRSLLEPEVPGLITAWWMAPLHILSMGMGWSDIAKGLEAWRVRGYETDHHILRFIRATWGDSIEALEIFLKDTAGFYVSETLGGNALFASQKEGAEEAQIARFKSAHSAEQWFWLTEPLINLEDGWDPLHLTTHFEDSFSTEDRGQLLDDESIEVDRSGMKIMFESYAGWYQRALEQVHSYAKGVEDADPAELNLSITISIKQMGSLGNFAFGDSTRRLQRVGDDQLPINGSGFWHMVGANPG